jgi:hypothetical protein
MAGQAALSTVSSDRSTSARPQVSFGGTVKQSEQEFTVADAEAVRKLRVALAK